MTNADSIKSLAQDVVASYEGRIALAGQRVQDVAKISRDVATLLQGFDKTHSETGAQLKSDLTEAEKARLAEVSKLRQEARELVDAFRKDLSQVSDVWCDLVATMAAKRGMAVAAPGAESAVIEAEKMPPAPKPRRKKASRKMA